MLAERDRPSNRDGYRWWKLAVSILGISDSDVNGMTKTNAGFQAMIAAKARPGGGFDYFQGQMQAVIDSLFALGILTASNINVATVALITAIFTTNDDSLTNLPANSFSYPTYISYPGGPSIA